MNVTFAVNDNGWGRPAPFGHGNFKRWFLTRLIGYLAAMLIPVAVLVLAAYVKAHPDLLHNALFIGPSVVALVINAIYGRLIFRRSDTLSQIDIESLETTISGKLGPDFHVDVDIQG